MITLTRDTTFQAILIQLTAPGGKLRLQYASFDGPDLYDDPNAYSQTEYYADPLSRVREVGSPGEDFRVGANTTKFWYFGVARSDLATITLTSVTGLTGTVSIKNGFITTITPSGTNTVSDVLDALNTYLLTEDPNPFGTVTNTLTLVKDPNGNIFQEMNDSYGRKIATRADASSGSDDEIIAEYEYDILSRLVAEKTPKHAPESGSPVQLISNTVYEYNPLSQLTRVILPDESEKQYEYNDAGNLTYSRSYKENQMIRELRYSYDKLQRDTTVCQFTSIIDGQRNYETKIRKIYDNVQKLLGSEKKYGIPQGYLQNLKNLKGRLVAIIAVNNVQGREYYVIEFFDYDNEGRVAAKYKIIPGLSMQKLSFEYDLQGKKTEETFTRGVEQIIKKYNYNSQGLLRSIEHVGSSNTTLVEYDFNDLGQLKTKNLGIGTGHAVNFDYNIQEWLTSIQSPAATGFYENISYNGMYNGNIQKTDYKYKSSTEEINHSQEYTYDQVNRLKGVSSATAGYDAGYDYDEIGRFKSKVEGNSNNDHYEYYTNVSRLKRAKTGGSEYIYNEHGSMVIDIGKKMVIELDYREMPVMFRFYDQIPVSGTQIGVDSKGTYVINDPTCTDCDLYDYLEKLEQNSTIQLLSSVTMLYDAAGNRVCKIENSQ